MDVSDRLFNAFMYPLEAAALRARRRALIPCAAGRALEVGAGTGANLRYYRWERLRALCLLDLAPGRALGRPRRIRGVPVTVAAGDVQWLPFPDGSFDTVISTLVLCSVDDQDRGLAEMRRVLVPGGTLLFMEHVRPVLPLLRRGVDALAPYWRAMTGSCRIDRETLAAIRRAGFALRAVRSGAGGLLVDGVAQRPA
jgi:ubiquinone/menaquinone biosynthesis C-methylase UbiE